MTNYDPIYDTIQEQRFPQPDLEHDFYEALLNHLQETKKIKHLTDTTK
jgi:hypothetical protein